MRRTGGRAVKRTFGVVAAACAAASLAAVVSPAVASAAVNSATSSIPGPGGTVEMHATANCVLADGRCYFNTQTNLLTPGGPTGMPGDTWARQTITLRSTDRDVWQESSYSAPAGMPLESKGANHDNVLSKAYRALNDVEISLTYFGGGPIERFKVDGISTPIDWASGRPNTEAGFIACSRIQVVYGGANITTPPACAQATFS